MWQGLSELQKRLLKEAGWSKLRQGSRASHEIWSNQNGSGLKVSVPVKIKSRHTANAILKAAGIGKSV